MSETGTRAERLRQLTADQLMALHNILSYAYYDERILKVELRREIARRTKDGETKTTT